MHPHLEAHVEGNVLLYVVAHVDDKQVHTRLARMPHAGAACACS
jgi:hypothetical protein